MSKANHIPPAWFCGCGGADPTKPLKEVLSIFTNQGLDDPYIDLKEFRRVSEIYTTDVVELILYFLDDLGYVSHSGSVSSSYSLTVNGQILKDLVDQGCMMEDENG